MSESAPNRARPVGINHVALEVGDIDAALEFYRSLLAFDLRGRSESMAFIDMGDQFIALAEAEDGAPDDHRHVGLVVDDLAAIEARIEAEGVERLPTGGLDIRDPWGNRLQIVAYEDVQFTKADHVRHGMGLADLDKSASALAELEEKGLAPDGSETTQD